MNVTWMNIVDHEKNKRRSKIVLPVAFLNTLSNADSIDFSSTNDICIPYILSLSFSLLLNQNYMWINDLHHHHHHHDIDFIDLNSIQKRRLWPFSSFITWYWEKEKKSSFFICSFYFKQKKKLKLSIQIQIWIRSNIKLILKIQKDIIFYSKFESIFYFILSFESLRMSQNEREIHFWWNLNRILSRCDNKNRWSKQKKEKKTFFCFFSDKNLPKITHICRVSSCHHENRSIFENKIS